jgi:hypothetical protein
MDKYTTQTDISYMNSQRAHDKYEILENGISNQVQSFSPLLRLKLAISVISDLIALIMQILIIVALLGGANYALQAYNQELQNLTKQSLKK